MPIEFCGSMMKQSQSLSCISTEYPPDDALGLFDKNSGMLTRVISEIFKCSQDNQQRLQSILQQQTINQIQNQNSDSDHHHHSSDEENDIDIDDDDHDHDHDHDHDQILGSSPTSPLMIEKLNALKQIQKQQQESSVNEQKQQQQQQDVGVAATPVGLRRCESVDLGQLFHIAEIQGEMENEKVVDLQAKQKLGGRTYQSADEDVFTNPRQRAPNACSCFNVSRGSIWQMKQVVEYTQANFPLTSFQQWQYGEENSGLSYLFHLLQQPNACIQMRCKAAQCLACLCQKSSVATEFSSRMNGLQVLFDLTISSHTHMHALNDVHACQLRKNLVEALVCIVLRTDMQYMYNMQADLLRGLRELIFLNRNGEIGGQVLKFCGERNVVEKLAKSLQEELSARLGEMYVGTLPLK